MAANTAKSFLRTRFFFNEKNSDGNEDRPEYVRKQRVHIGGDNIECRVAKRKPHHSFNELLGTEQQWNASKR